MDLFGSQDYRVPYSHRAGMFTFKQDFQRVFEASGTTTTLQTRYWQDPGGGLNRVTAQRETF